MSYAVVATRRTDVPTAKAKSAPKAASNSLRIGNPNDVFEQDADRVADQVMAGASGGRAWSLSEIHPGVALQRKCACGNTTGVAGACEECEHKKSFQAKMAVGASNDPLEQEADRIADQVLTPPKRSTLSGAVPPIQGFTGQPARPAETSAPSSVDHVLASPGSPLNAALQQDMEQRFGYDFSRVRVHSNAAAERSARDVMAHAYTVGHNIVFGAGRFAPGTHEGKRLIAHELAHVVQQSGSAGRRATQSTETGVPLSHPSNRHIDQTVSTPGQGLRLQRWSWADIKEKAYDSMIAGIHKARDGMRNGLKSLAAQHLPASLYPVADSIIEGAVTVVEVLVTLILAVLGIVVGFSEGIIGMIKGLFDLGYGVIKLLTDAITGIFTNFDAAKQDLNAVWEALKNLPSRLKKLVTDWLDKFGKASSERQSLMISELTGQILAMIATAAASASRAGTAAKVAAAGDTATATGEAAAATGAAGDAAVTTARVKPVLTVIEGGGGKAGSAATRAAAGPGAADVAGNTALKVAPAADPVAPPLRLVPPLPAEAAPAAAPAPAALAPGSSTKAAIATGTGVAAATATNLATKPAPKKPACGSPTGLTRGDPIPMTWFKVRADDYYPKRLSIQGHMFDRDDPSNPRTLPHGEPLGVPERFWPRLNKIMQLVPSDRGDNADRFRAVLTGYGFDWSGLQADHVQDLDWGGPDEFANLWPLSSAANMSAGGRQNNQQRITYCETPDGPQVVNQTLLEFKQEPGHFGRYFRIASVER